MGCWVPAVVTTPIGALSLIDDEGREVGDFLALSWQRTALAWLVAQPPSLVRRSRARCDLAEKREASAAETVLASSLQCVVPYGHYCLSEVRSSGARQFTGRMAKEDPFRFPGE